MNVEFEQEIAEGYFFVFSAISSSGRSADAGHETKPSTEDITRSKESFSVSSAISCSNSIVAFAASGPMTRLQLEIAEGSSLCFRLPVQIRSAGRQVNETRASTGGSRYPTCVARRSTLLDSRDFFLDFLCFLRYLLFKFVCRICSGLTNDKASTGDRRYPTCVARRSTLSDYGEQRTTSPFPH